MFNSTNTPLQSTAAKAVSASILSLVSIFAICGNLMVMFVVHRSRNLWSTATNILIFNLALADLFVGLLVMPCAIDVIASGRWRCGEIGKILNGFGNFCFCIASIINLMILSMDRYFSICKPYKYPRIFTFKTAIFLCGFIWSYSAFWALPPLVGVSSYECFIPYIGHCSSKDWSKYGLNFVFALSVVSGTYGLASVVMCIVYLKIFKTARKQNRKIHIQTNQTQSNSNLSARSRQKSNMKAAITLLIIILSYLACWSPFCVLLFIEIATGEKQSGIFGCVAMWIGFSQSACNPLIYSIKYKSFRASLFRLFNYQSTDLSFDSTHLEQNSQSLAFVVPSSCSRNSHRLEERHVDTEI